MIDECELLMQIVKPIVERRQVYVEMLKSKPNDLCYVVIAVRMSSYLVVDMRSQLGRFMFWQLHCDLLQLWFFATCSQSPHWK